MQEHPVQKGDVYLLCSDGLSDMIGDDDMAVTINTFGANLELGRQAADPDGQRQRRQGQHLGGPRAGFGLIPGPTRYI